METKYVIAAILWFMVNCSAEGKDCSQVEKNASTKTSIEHIQKLIANSEYSCAVQATTELAKAFASLPDRDGFDARFALRELALEEDKNRNIPPAFRVKLTEGAAGSLQLNKPIPAVELIADIRFLLNAMLVLQQQGEAGSSLHMLGDAVQLNQQLPLEERAIQSQELYGISDVLQECVYKNYSAEEWDKLIKLAEITRGDKALLTFRSQFASWFHYWVPRNYDNRSHEEIIARSKYILQLTEKLDDAPTNFPTTGQCITGKVGDPGCFMGWQSRPYISAGLAFHYVGMKDEAKRSVEQGLSVIEREKNPEYRMQLYSFILRDLIRNHYDRATLVDVSTKLQTLADSLDTPRAKEIRSELTNRGYGK